MTERDEKLRQSLELALSSTKYPEASRKAISILFPKARRALRDWAGSDHDDSGAAKRARRISDRDSAAGYFALTPGSARFTRLDLNSLALGNFPEALVRIVQLIDGAEPDESPQLKIQTLDAMRGIFNNDRPATVEEFRTLLRLSEFFLKGTALDSKKPFSFTEIDRLRLIGIEALSSVSVGERAEFFYSSVDDINDLTLACEIFRAIEGDIRPDGAAKDRRPDATLGSFEQRIRAQLLEAVENCALTDGMWSQSIPRIVLWFWWGSTVSGDVVDFTAGELGVNSAALALMDSLLSVRNSSTVGTRFVVASEADGRIADLGAVLRRAQTLAGDPSLTKDDQDRAKRFLDAYRNSATE